MLRQFYITLHTENLHKTPSLVSLWFRYLHYFNYYIFRSFLYNCNYTYKVLLIIVLHNTVYHVQKLWNTYSDIFYLYKVIALGTYSTCLPSCFSVIEREWFICCADAAWFQSFSQSVAAVRLEQRCICLWCCANVACNSYKVLYIYFVIVQTYTMEMQNHKNENGKGTLLLVKVCSVYVRNVDPVVCKYQDLVTKYWHG